MIFTNWFDWNAYENPCFDIVLLLLLLLFLLLRFVKLDSCYRLQTWYTPWGVPYKHFWGKNFLVWLELVHVLNGLTSNWTFAYCPTISALGLVIWFDHPTQPTNQPAQQGLPSWMSRACPTCLVGPTELAWGNPPIFSFKICPFHYPVSIFITFWDSKGKINSTYMAACLWR